MDGSISTTTFLISTSALHPQTHKSPHRYIQNQTHVNASMRAILVDWLVEVHMKFRLVPETLHLAVNIIDRYLTTVEVPRQTLQLVGVTSLLLAAKYEEIYPPEVKDCVCITDRAYTKQDILDMEADILNELSFNLTVPTGHPFLQRFLFITKASRTMESAAHYYAERMLQEHDALQFRPSAIAAAAVCLALNHPEIRDFDELDTEKPGVVRLQQMRNFQNELAWSWLTIAFTSLRSL
jgi:Cyclin, N-terminal domain/Cyclin, C-terminal domain